MLIEPEGMFMPDDGVEVAFVLIEPEGMFVPDDELGAAPVAGAADALTITFPVIHGWTWQK